MTSTGHGENVANETKQPFSVSKEDYYLLSHYLADTHVIFSKFWEMGMPSFSTAIPTACIRFDKKTFAPTFMFNPDFWQKLNNYTRAFIIAHEMLHIILRHGYRVKDLKKQEKDVGNACLDIVVNHLLVNKFGFSRNKLKLPLDMFDEKDKCCWLDTVFENWADKDKNGEVDRTPNAREYGYKPEPCIKVPASPSGTKEKLYEDQSFESYFIALKRLIGKIDLSQLSFDSHESGDGEKGDKSDNRDSEAWEGVLQDLNDDMSHASQEEQKILKEMLDDFGVVPSEQEGAAAGKGAGNMWTFIDTMGVTYKSKWETIIKKWAMPLISEKRQAAERWGMPHRRTALMPKNGIYLPIKMDTDQFVPEEDMIEVYFFLDTSGSCWGLKDRFFRAAKSLPPKIFKVRLFSFDDVVTELDINKNQVRGGGGTSFSIIEQKIQEICKKENKEYPRAVWVMTDGCGTCVHPQFPDRWGWFLSADYRSYIPPGSKIFQLRDFE